MSIIRMFWACSLYVVLWFSPEAVAQTKDEILELKQFMQTAFNAHDMDQFMPFATEDFVYDYAPLPVPMSGEEFGAFMEDLFHGFPDIVFPEDLVLISGNILVEEHILLGTHLGAWQGLPPSGKLMWFPQIDIWEFEGNKIKRGTTYSDRTITLINIGVIEPPDISPIAPSFALPTPEPLDLTPTEAAGEFLMQWNSHDPAGLAKLVHPGADILQNAVSMSREAYIAASEQCFSAYSDLLFDPVRIIPLGENWALVECVMMGTNDGPYFGDLASGRQVEVRTVFLERWDKDGLLYLHTYFDNLTVLSQLERFGDASVGEWEMHR